MTIKEHLQQKLDEKLITFNSLYSEIRDIQVQIEKEKWANIPECQHSFEDVSSNKCPYASTYRSIIYCKNINCHK